MDGTTRSFFETTGQVISIVMQLTDLTARQIRYYEEHDLIQPHRTEGNRRMFSLNDVDKLLEIKDKY